MLQNEDCVTYRLFNISTPPQIAHTLCPTNSHLLNYQQDHKTNQVLFYVKNVWNVQLEMNSRLLIGYSVSNRRRQRAMRNKGNRMCVVLVRKPHGWEVLSADDSDPVNGIVCVGENEGISELRFLRLNERNVSLVTICAVILVIQRLSIEATFCLTVDVQSPPPDGA